jgi:hypothetical protein
MFLPGWFLFGAIFGKNKTVSLLEKFVLSFGLGIVITNFIAFFYSKINLPITAFSSILGIIIFCVICFVIYKFKKTDTSEEKNETENLFSFSKNQFILILLLLFLTFFIKIAFLSGTVAPTATDMGHHMYWVKQMAEIGQLPTYEGMPDFIIGEHIIFSEISMISGLNVFSAFPMTVLLFINILSILSVFILTLRIFKNKTVAILSLLFLGALFAISSPQAKFVSGGVIGNIMGNFLLPVSFYFYFRAFNDTFKNNDNVKFLSLAIFATFGLFYTHHLTAFIFLFAFSFLAVLYLAINFRNLKTILAEIGKIIFSPAVVATFIFGLFFFFFVFTPNYAAVTAVNTAVGTPSKETREGLSLSDLKFSVGEARLALGLVGFLLLTLIYKKRDFGLTMIFSWTIMIFIMSIWPHFLFINLPSSRIGNYLSYPLAILAAAGLYFLFNPVFFNAKTNGSFILIPKQLISGFFVIIMIFILKDGLADSVQVFKKSPDFSPVQKVFDASEYLAKNISPADVILKDHNYLNGDTWMKLFFMRGYKYPLSRGYFKRYEDITKPREMCTLYMISNPKGKEAEECFQKTGVNFIMVNPRYDSLQFEKLNNFNKIYNNGETAIYYRK